MEKPEKIVLFRLNLANVKLIWLTLEMKKHLINKIKEDFQLKYIN